MEGTERIKGGDIHYKLDIIDDDNFSNLAENINNIGEGLDKAIYNQLKSERLKSELITNVSHDLKTPLTSIINYIELIKKEEDIKPEHIKDLNEAGFKCWDWDVDSLDWKYTDANQVFENVQHYTELRKDATNLVVLFHEKNSTLEVLPRVIEYYQSLGYEFLPYNPEQHFTRNFFHSDEI